MAPQRLGNLLFLRRRPAAHGGAGDGGPLEHQGLNVDLMGHSPAHKADDDQPPVLFQQPQVAVKVRAAHDIQNDIHPFIVGQLMNFLSEIFGFVVDRRGVGPQRGNFFVLADGGIDGHPQRVTQQDRGGANPAGAAVDQNALAGLQLTELENVRPHREEGFRNGGRFAKAEASRDRQRLACRDGAVFGIPAAVGQRADAIPGGKGRNLRTNLHDHARHLEAGHGGNPLRHGIQTLALQNIRPVDARRFHLDEHLMLPDSGDLTFADLQYLRATRLADSDIFHGSSLSPVRELSKASGRAMGAPVLRGDRPPLPGCLV